MPAIAVVMTASDQDDQEVDVDARAASTAKPETRMWMPLPSPTFEKKPGAEAAGRVGADREERHVAEVQQAGEADHDVQAERHDDVGERLACTSG